MENKYNEATPQRPEGDRVLDAPLVAIDLNQFMEQVKAEETWTNSDRNSITVFKSTRLTMVLIGLHKNAAMKKHTADGDITVQVLEGNLHFSTDTKECDLQKGQMLALHARIPHSVEAKEDSFFLLTKFSDS